QFNSASLNRHISSTYRLDLFSGGFVEILVAEQTPDNQSWFQGTADAVSEEVEKAKASVTPRLAGIVMDLRGNPGGLLKQSIKLADLMLTHGHILTTKGRHPDSLHHYEAGGRDIAGGIPIVVIIDGKSASASEIVAAALQDRDRAVVIGTSSFGKGSVQTVVRLPNDGEMTLTWSRFLAPSGYVLHGLGVRPTICTADVRNDLMPAIDAALANRLNLRATFASWRAGGAPDEARRHALRGACPATRRKTYNDIRIATYLAEHPALYAKALDIASATAEAHN
ncbi:MAG: S41 family peptidase, partial [Rhodospirillaceae bacterium]